MFGGGRNVADFCAFVDADAAGAEFARGGEDIGHEQAVGLEEVVAIGGVEAGEGFVGTDGSLDFADVEGRAKDGGAVDDGGDLVGAEAVTFDRQGSLNGADAVLFAELGGGGEGRVIKLANLLGDDADLVNDGWDDGEGGLVGHLTGTGALYWCH